MIKIIKKIIYLIISLILVLALAVFSANLYVLKAGEKNIKNKDTVANAPYILVFGASVNGNKVSHVLSQRLDTVYDLYKNKKTEKIIVSGDHLLKDYNEVQAMKDYLIKKGVPESSIVMDHSGIDTFNSVSHLKENFNPESVILVTQSEHLKRALYFAKKIGVNAYGVACEDYSGEQLNYQHKREFLARMKAFILCEIFKNDTEKLDKINEKLKLVYNENFD